MASYDESDCESQSEPLQECASDINTTELTLAAQLADLPEVKNLISYINTLRPSNEEYTANKWREIVTDSKKMLSFGRLGDWYQFILQQKARIIFNAELNQNELAPYAELLSIEKLIGGLKPEEVNWKDIVESFDYDPPCFNETSTLIELKLSVPQKGYIILVIQSWAYERYYESADQKVGDNGQLNILVVDSTIRELQEYAKLDVAWHDETEYEFYSAPTKKVWPIYPDTEFFKTLSSLIGLSKETIMKSLLELNHYPFSRCDWEDTWKDDEKSENIIVPKSYEHIRDEIATQVPSAMNIFSGGYLELSNHIKLLDYLAMTLQNNVLNHHLKFMTLLSLQEDSYFDYSTVTKMISDNTRWHSISKNFSWYEINVVDADNKHEYSMHAKIIVPGKYQYSEAESKLEIRITNVANEVLKNDFLRIFQRHMEHQNVKIMNKQEDLGTFSITITFRDLPWYSDDEKIMLVVIAKLMHLDWSVNQFLKFLFEVANMDEERIGHLSASLFQPSIDHSNCSSESMFEDDEISEADAMDQELSDIKMEVELDLVLDRPERVLRSERKKE
jgi:hypothetical protein